MASEYSSKEICIFEHFLNPPIKRKNPRNVPENAENYNKNKKLNLFLNLRNGLKTESRVQHNYNPWHLS